MPKRTVKIVSGGDIPQLFSKEWSQQLMNQPSTSLKAQVDELKKKSQQPGFRPYQPAPKGNLFSRAVDGIISTQAGLWNAGVKGARTGATLRLKEYIHSDTGIAPIVGLYIGRHPIVTGVKMIMDFLSEGGFSDTQEKLKYDEVYHNYLIAVSNNGAVTKLEKNEVIEAHSIKADDSSWQNETHVIPLPHDRVLTIKELIDNSSYRGAQFWEYNPSSNNCQVFCGSVLEDSGLLEGITDPATWELILPQDAKQLVESLGKASWIPKATTDLASRLDRLRYGDGVYGKITSGQSGRLTIQDVMAHLDTVGRG